MRGFDGLRHFVNVGKKFGALFRGREALLFERLDEIENLVLAATLHCVENGVGLRNVGKDRDGAAHVAGRVGDVRQVRHILGGTRRPDLRGRPPRRIEGVLHVFHLPALRHHQRLLMKDFFALVGKREEALSNLDAAEDRGGAANHSFQPEADAVERCFELVGTRLEAEHILANDGEDRRDGVRHAQVDRNVVGRRHVTGPRSVARSTRSQSRRAVPWQLRSHLARRERSSVFREFRGLPFALRRRPLRFSRRVRSLIRSLNLAFL
ncbi:MAG: hypothetical protein ABSF67_03540 [Roseiarcus sp.]